MIVTLLFKITLTSWLLVLWYNKWGRKNKTVHNFLWKKSRKSWLPLIVEGYVKLVYAWTALIILGIIWL